MLIAYLPEAREKGRRGNQEAAFAEDGLNQDCGCLARMAMCFEHPSKRLQSAVAAIAGLVGHRQSGGMAQNNDIIMTSIAGWPLWKETARWIMRGQDEYTRVRKGYTVAWYMGAAPMMKRMGHSLPCNSPMGQCMVLSCSRCLHWPPAPGSAGSLATGPQQPRASSAKSSTISAFAACTAAGWDNVRSSARCR